jgi:hypothetical protein
MRRRRLILIVCGLLVVLLATSALCLLIGGSSRKVTRANFEKIQEGMTKDEVEAILGGENGKMLFGSFPEGCPKPFAYSDDEGSWLWPGDTIEVHYDNIYPDTYRVTHKTLERATPRRAWERLQERVKRWIGW